MNHPIFIFVLFFSLVPGAILARAPEVLAWKLVRKIPHNRESFTQGLLHHEGALYESTGLYGKSALNKLDLRTGETLQTSKIGARFFGEGLERVGDRLIQLTWKEEVALVYDLETFEKVAEFHYEGEGWGLCYDGQHLIMSDGSPFLTFRDPNTFEPLHRLVVREGEWAIQNLNELEYIDGYVFANVWGTPLIVKIHPQTGNIEGKLDLRGLLTARELREADVLNGIAYDSGTGRLYVTGKLWPWIFEIGLEKESGGRNAGKLPVGSGS